jgi:hypothetical protein
MLAERWPVTVSAAKGIPGSCRRGALAESPPMAGIALAGGVESAKRIGSKNASSDFSQAGQNRHLVPTFVIYRKDVHKRSELLRNSLTISMVIGSDLRGHLFCKSRVPASRDNFSLNVHLAVRPSRECLNEYKCLSLAALNERGLFNPGLSKSSPFQAPVDIFSVAA